MTGTRPFRQQIELVLTLAKRDLKTKYKESVLGFLWSLLRPLLLTLIIWFVFSKVIPVPFRHDLVPYWLHVLLSLLVWNFFVGTLTEAIHSLPANANLIKKVRLDSEVFPIAALVSNGVHFVLALLVVLALKVGLGLGLGWTVLLAPFVLAVLVVLTLGLALWLSALQVFFRDVASGFELFALAWFYVTPIIYPLQVAESSIQKGLGAGWFSVYMLNPVAPIVGALRRVVLYETGAGEISYRVIIPYLAIASVVSFACLISGWWFFRRVSPRFADEL